MPPRHRSDTGGQSFLYPTTRVRVHMRLHFVGIPKGIGQPGPAAPIVVAPYHHCPTNSPRRLMLTAVLLDPLKPLMAKVNSATGPQ